MSVGVDLGLVCERSNFCGMEHGMCSEKFVVAGELFVSDIVVMRVEISHEKEES